MLQGEKLYRENKHRKIIVRNPISGGIKFRVVKTTNTLKPAVGSLLRENEVQDFIDQGFTVTVVLTGTA